MTDELNGYGLTDAELREARKFAKGVLKGSDPDPIKVAPDEEPVVAEETASAEPVEEVQATDVTQPEATPAETIVATDPLAELPEETRTKIQALLDAEREKAKDLQHRESSSRGRLSAFQRKAEEAARELAELKAQRQPSPSKPLKELDSPRLKELAESDPAYLEALEEALSHRDKEWEERIKARDEKFDGYIKQQETARTEEYNHQFTEKLDSAYENWREIVYKVDSSGNVLLNEDKVPIFSDQWAHCIREQPPALQRAMLDVGTPEDALWAIDHHTNWLKTRGYIQGEAQVTAPNPQADKIKEKREQDLKKGPVPKSASVPLSTAPAVLTDYSDEKTIERLRKAAREALSKGKPDIYRDAR